MQQSKLKIYVYNNRLSFGDSLLRCACYALAVVKWAVAIHASAKGLLSLGCCCSPDRI